MLSLGPATPLADAERVKFEVDVFFDVLLAYPPDIAFDKLDDLIARMNTTFRIESVRIVSSQDGNERDLSSFQLARKRAAFLQRYFLAAGVPTAVPVELSERAAKQPDTPEGRARDRVAEITVVALRRQAPGR